MSDAQRFAFLLGSGVATDAMLLGIVGVVLTLAFVWAAWVSIGAFRSWQAGSIGLLDLTWSVLRAAILLMALGYFLSQ